MAPCLSKLPSVCLEGIFKHVPLGDLFRSVGLVCTSWLKPLCTELKRRKRLVIVQHEEALDHNIIYNSYGNPLIRDVRHEDGSAWITLESLEQIKFNAVVPDDLRKFFFSLMNMSNVTHVFCTIPSSVLTQVIRLIDHFSEHLIDLKLSVVRSSTDTEENLAQKVINLFACLDRLSSLRHLKLCLDVPDLDVPPQLSFLSRLITFVIRFGAYGDRADWILPSILQYGGNVGSIELHNQVQFDELIRVGAEHATKFNVLFLDQIDVEQYDDMKLFVVRFNSLTDLTLNNISIPMKMLARCLAQLTQLVQLSLQIDDIYFNVEEEQQQAQQQIVQLPSVRVLSFFFTTESHLESERFFIPEIFINLQVLTFIHSILACPECVIPFQDDFGLYFPDGHEPELARRLAECTRLARQPFRRCANLHTIQVEDSYVANELEITLNEL